MQVPGKAADGQHDDHCEYRGEAYRVAATVGGNYDFERRNREQSEKCLASFKGK